MTGYRLYWKEGSGSMVVEAALRLAGLPFDAVRIEGAAARAPDFVALNPAGKVPVLALATGQVITESAAILLALDDEFPEKRLLPPRGTPMRNVAVQWLIFMAASIYPAALRYYHPERHTADANAEAAIKLQASLDMDRDFGQLADAIEGPFLLGQTMTITDVYAAMLADWHRPALDLPEIATLTAHVLNNPAVSQAWRNHGFGE